MRWSVIGHAAELSSVVLPSENVMRVLAVWCVLTPRVARAAGACSKKPADARLEGRGEHEPSRAEAAKDRSFTASLVQRLATTPAR